MVWKRWAALGLSLALLLGLTACGQEPQPAESPEPETPAAETPAPTTADPSLTHLRTTLAEKDSPWAIAFLGDLSQGSSPEDLLAETDYPETYPFLADITGDQVVTYEGTEVYCVVPRDEKATLTVQTCVCGADGQPIPQETLYQGDGQPVILVCNVSDIIPNLLVTVTAPGGSPVSYAPGLSLCDGSVALPADSAIYDFSLYPDAPKGNTDTDFLGSWTATVTQEGREVLCQLDFQSDGTMACRVGYPDSEWMDVLEGTFYVIETSSQYPVGSVLFEMTSTMDQSPFWGVFSLENSGSALTVTHISGDSLLYGFDGQAITLTPR